MSTTAAIVGALGLVAVGITLITLYLTLVTLVVFHSLVILWPPNRVNDLRGCFTAMSPPQ